VRFRRPICYRLPGLGLTAAARPSVLRPACRS
jgi:hypothetical protein